MMCWRNFWPEKFGGQNVTGMSSACNDNIEGQIEEAPGTLGRDGAWRVEAIRKRPRNRTKLESHTGRNCCRFGKERNVVEGGKQRNGLCVDSAGVRTLASRSDIVELLQSTATTAEMVHEIPVASTPNLIPPCCEGGRTTWRDMTFMQ